MKKYKVMMLCMASCLLFLAACTQGGADEDVIRIGVNLELSGAYVDYGTQELNGVKLAVKQINDAGGIDGKMIELVTYDNKSEAATAVELQTKLATEDKVSVIVGPAVSSNAKAVVPVSEDYSVPVVFASATAEGVVNDGAAAYEYAFRICFGDSFQGVTIANFASESLSATKAAVLKATNDYGTGLSDNFIKQFEANGGVIVKEESFTIGESDFSSVLTNIKNAGDFDVLYVPGYYAEAGKIIAQARSLGIDVPILGGDGFEAPELLGIAGASALNDIYYTSHYSSLASDTALQDFMDAYEAEYNASPSAFNALGYDAAQLALDAVERAGDTDASVVKDTLKATKGFVGVTGTIDFDALHEAVKSSFVVELTDGVAASAVKVNP